MNLEFDITKDDIVNKAVEKLIQRFDDGGLTGYVREEVKAAITREMLAQAKPKIDALLDEVLGSILDKPYNPVNEWGEPTKKQPTTLRSMLQEKALGYLSQKVGKDGKPTTYNPYSTRAEFMAKKAAEEAVDSSCKNQIKEVVASTRAELQKQITECFAQMLTKP